MEDIAVRCEDHVFFVVYDDDDDDDDDGRSSNVVFKREMIFVRLGTLHRGPWNTSQFGFAAQNDASSQSCLDHFTIVSLGMVPMEDRERNHEGSSPGVVVVLPACMKTTVEYYDYCT